jgi:beta-glucanase (GH16 family)
MNSRAWLRNLLLVAMAGGVGGFGRCGPAENPWHIVWQDEFEGSELQAPDPTRWRFDVGTGPNNDGWGNGQQEFDTARPENVSLDGNGHLRITALKENYLGLGYTSGRILTKGLLSMAYGRFEARMKLPSGQGLWPAFWMMGANIDTSPWPACGEIDVMEYRGQEPRRITGSLHGPGYFGATPITGDYTLPVGSPGFDGDFHVFAVEWEPDLVTWEVDGVVWQVATPQRMPAGGTWVFDHPFFMILNLAVGGSYVGVVDGTATFPQTLLVDYVRVYERVP